MKTISQLKLNASLQTSMRTLLGLMTFFLVITLYSSVSCAEAVSPPAVAMVPENFTDLAKQSSPAVVNISTVKTIKSGGPVFRHFFGNPRGPTGPDDQFNQFFQQFFDNMPEREFKENSLGSGFIMDAEGHIITNNHVIADADEIKVKLKDNKEYDAKIIGKDATTDIALLKINADKSLPYLKMGDSDKLDVGQWVIAIGNPFGLSDTVTAGIVSAKGRVIGAGPYDDFIQTDASINPGNSGGPLINMEGEVVGIDTAIIAGGGGGIGFAIPINMAKNVIAQLKKSGEVTRGWLGVGLQDLDEQLKTYYGVQSGVLVSDVFPGDPADKAGIRVNDIIVSVNGTPVNSSRELSMLIAAVPVGEKAEIKINRKGEMLTKSVVIVKREEEKLAAMGGKAPSGQAMGPLGIQAADISPEIARQLRLRDTEGVVVMDVDPNSKADQAGIQKGDVITEINHKAIKNMNDYTKIINNAKQGEALEFLVKSVNDGYNIIKLTK